METFGETIRKLREVKKTPLRIVASYLNIDQAILSKVERGHRSATRPQVVKLAEYFNIEENVLLISWLSDKLIDEVAEEQVALKALQVAEEKLEYIAFKKINRKEILKSLILGLGGFQKIEKAWIYGSFARADDGPKSDVDIALQADSTFSYFDLAEVQHVLQNNINRKVDVGFIDSFKPYILEHVKSDLKLIYERQPH
jgi:predicted nucleotidyltransferase